PPRIVPLPAQLAASADVRDGPHSAAFGPGKQGWVEGGGIGETVRSIGGEQRGVTAVTLQAFAVNDREWDPGSISRQSLDLLDLKLGEGRRCGRCPTRVSPCTCRHVILEDQRSFDPRGYLQERLGASGFS